MSRVYFSLLRRDQFRLSFPFSLFTFFFSLLPFHLIVFAQQAETDSLKYQLDSVIVSASRFEQPINEIPFSINIIDQSTLNLSRESLSSESIFRYVPGIIVNNRYNLSQGDRISIRGIGSRSQFGVRGIKILLDGIPLTFPDGQSQLNNLDINTIGRVEVIRGPSSFLYGNSSGGVIYIQSRNLNSNVFNINPGFSLGSFGFRKYSLNASGKLGNNSLLININKINYDGFRENSAASSTAFNIISNQYFNEKLSLKAVINFYDAPYLLNPSTLSKSDAESNPETARLFVKKQGSGKEIKQGQAGVSFFYNPDEVHKFEATLYGISRSMLNPIPGRYIKLNRLSGGLRTNYSTKFNVSKINFAFFAGGDFEFQNDVRTEFENNGLSDNDFNTVAKSEIIRKVRSGNMLLDQNEKVKSYGLFSKLEFSPFEKVSVSIGLRYDKFNFDADDKFLLDGVDNSGSMKMDNISKMIGAAYRFNEHFQMFTNYSTSFEVPTTNELSNTPNGAGGFNTLLTPEQIESFEIGIRGDWLDRKFFYNASIYKLNIDRILIPYQLQNQQGDEVYYRNSGNAVNNGLELFANWIPVQQINFTFLFSHMNFTYKNFILEKMINGSHFEVQLDGNKVPGIPKNKLAFGIVYNFISGLSTELYFNWTDKIFVNDMNGSGLESDNESNFINDSYATADLKFVYNFSYGLGNYDLFFGIINLFDTNYNSSIVPNAVGDRYYEPAALRNWYGGVSISFQ